MTVAYCIAAHKRPSLTKRLISRLVSDDPNSLVILHYDQQYEPLSLPDVASPQVRVLPKRRLVWGGPELMQLQREMVSLALSEGSKYAVLPSDPMSGLKDNPAHYDSSSLFEWNERALIGLGGSWDLPPQVRPCGTRCS